MERVRTCSYLFQALRPCNMIEHYQSETDNDGGLLSDSSATTWPRGHPCALQNAAVSERERNV
jgi:hypothetical protein